MEKQRGYGIAFSSVGERVTDTNNRFLRRSRSMEKPKLHYFPVRGRAELVRLVLAAAGIDFEDLRYTGPEWQQFKPKTLTGQLPMLELPGKGRLAQSGAIARYIARENDLAGKDNFERARVEMFMGCIDDLMSAMGSAYFEKDDVRKEEMFAKFASETLPLMLSNLNALAGPSYFCGNGLTVADIALFDFIGKLSGDMKNLSAYPRLQAICENVGKRANIAKWIEQRPHSDS